MSQPETITEARTRITTETVTRYECPGCGQFVEDEELMPVLVNVEPEEIDRLSGAVLENHAQVCCRYCAASLWDFEPAETARTDAILRRGERVASTSRALLSALTPSQNTLALLVGLAIPVLVAVVVFDALMGAIDPAAFEQAEPPPAFGAPLPFLNLLPIVLLGTLIVVILNKMPRV